MKAEIVQNQELSNELLNKLLELTKQNSLDSAILKLVHDFIQTKLAYWTLVDKRFQENKGMSFKEYEDTKREEWDGSDGTKIEEYNDWEDAIVGIMYYEDLKQKWTSLNLSQK